MNRVEITPENLKAAAEYGMKLLETPGTVAVDSASSLNGNLNLLYLLLRNIASGELVVGNKVPEQEPEQEALDTPEEDKDDSES